MWQLVVAASVASFAVGMLIGVVIGVSVKMVEVDD